ncbi:MAG: 2-succinyl-6-hydroxy-2,4-cyclohexadiene-1-carboxylate synthase [Deltaproteobacteria bacterium]|nr:2-succinyl-6-hydroxy-2,4-cyclohexadiene-1-carboxylate synthase [Deltaproteobacteria bacterium]
MQLNYDISIDHNSSQILLFLHGFTGNRTSFSHLQKTSLQQKRTFVSLDLPGHNNAPPPPSAISGWQATIEALVVVIDEIINKYSLKRRQVDLLGYSQGGRLALGLALKRPECINHLILESASPGLKSETERARRRAEDVELAQMLERDGLDSFITYWENLPLFGGLAQLPAELKNTLASRRRCHSAKGLAAALRGLGLGIQPSYWGELKKVSMPVLLITGARDQKFTSIAKAMAHELPQARHEIIAGCGHTPNLENTQKYVDLLTKFLS